MTGIRKRFEIFEDWIIFVRSIKCPTRRRFFVRHEVDLPRMIQPGVKVFMFVAIHVFFFKRQTTWQTFEIAPYTQTAPLKLMGFVM